MTERTCSPELLRSEVNGNSIHNDSEYVEAVNRLDKLMDSLYDYKKVKFNDSDEKTFYIYSLMEKIERLQDSITDYEVSLSQLKDVLFNKGEFSPENSPDNGAERQRS